MVLNGRTSIGTKVLYEKSVRDSCREESDFRDKLEDCLVKLCKDADIAVPLWLTKNSRELGRFGKTVFMREQFVEAVPFDKFEIRILER